MVLGREAERAFSFSGETTESVCGGSSCSSKLARVCREGALLYGGVPVHPLRKLFRLPWTSTRTVGRIDDLLQRFL